MEYCKKPGCVSTLKESLKENSKVEKDLNGVDWCGKRQSLNVGFAFCDFVILAGINSMSCNFTAKRNVMLPCSVGRFSVHPQGSYISREFSKP
jgi:hypothetical protein